MTKQHLYRWGIFPLWLLLTATVFFRMPIPIDETRYLSVAWEMWLRNDFLVPYLNGHAYSHKPPLLFWMFHLGWAAFGVNDWWPKLIGPICALINLLLIRQLAKKLWPNLPEIALLAPWVLISTLLWTLFAPAAMFDILLCCFVLLAMLGILEISRNHSFTGMVYLSTAIGLGLLSKGPVIFLHLVPVMFLVRFWIDKDTPRNWSLNLLLAILAGSIVALSWAVPAALSGGEGFGNEILWRQIADRTIKTEIHVRPIYWYLLFLPLCLFPWFFWPHLWRNRLQVTANEDSGTRFCMIWFQVGFLLFSVVTSKQIHYLIPLLPAFALLVSRILVFSPQTDSHDQIAMPVFFMLAGLLLVSLPYLPWFSTLHWVQGFHSGWGLAVMAVAVVMGVSLHLLHKYSVAIIASALVVGVFIGFICFFKYTGLAYDLRPAALRLKALQDQGKACAFVGDYQGQFHFLGRLDQPLPTISIYEIAEWASHHPDGILISIEKNRPETSLYSQMQREYWLVFRPAFQQEELRPI